MLARAINNEREHPRPLYAFIAPYLAQSKDAAWSYITHFAQPMMRDKNESELWVELLNGARIRIHGADNPDRLRGAYLDGAVLDEFGDFRAGVFGEVIRPMLADYEGWATFIGSAKGRNEFYERLVEAEGDPFNWYSARLPVSKTKIISEAELDKMARDMTAEQYEQELECSFDAAILGAIYGKEIGAAEREGRITDVAYDPTLPVDTAWDLGIGDATAIWFFQTAGNQVRVIDHYENFGQGLGHYVAELKARGYNYRFDFVPHDARVRDLGTGRSRLETLVGMGRKPSIFPEVSLMDGINAARVSFPHIWFDAIKCRQGLEALRQYRFEFDLKTKTFRDRPKHDFTSHTADAFRGLCLAWREQARPAKVVPGFDKSKPALAQVTVNQFLEGVRKQRHERV